MKMYDKVFTFKLFSADDVNTHEERRFTKKNMILTNVKVI